MEVTREVIEDLLPLYLAGEASEDTTALIESYLETDAELAEMVTQAATNGLFDKVPTPQYTEDAMEAYKKANKWMVVRTLGLSAIIATVFLCVMAFVPAVILFLSLLSK